MKKQTSHSTRPLSEVARHLCIPEGIVTTAWPMIAKQLVRMRYPLDAWQIGIGKLIFAKRESGMYACGIGGAVVSIPRQVGKTHMIAGFILALCAAKPNTLVLWSAHRSRTHNETFSAMQGIVNRQDIKPFIAHIRRGAGQEAIEFRNGSRILFGARENGFGRGFPEVDVIVMDEAQILTEKAMDDMVPATNAAPNGLVIMMGTPPRPVDPGEVFTQRREDALKGDKDTLYIECSADPGARLDDKKQWEKANPSYPARVSTTAFERMKKLLGSEDSFRREGLGIWDEKALANKAFQPEVWNRLEGELPESGRDVYGVRFSPDGLEVALAVARRPEEGPIFIEGIRSEPLSSGTTWLVDFLVERADRAAQIVIDGKAGVGYLVNALRENGVRSKTLIWQPSLEQVIAAHAMFDQAVISETVSHSAQPELTQQALSAHRRKIGSRGGFGWQAPEGGSVSLFEAATLAFWGAKMTRRKGKRKQVISV